MVIIVKLFRPNKASVPRNSPSADEDMLKELAVAYRVLITQRTAVVLTQIWLIEFSHSHFRVTGCLRCRVPTSLPDGWSSDFKALYYPIWSTLSTWTQSRSAGYIIPSTCIGLSTPDSLPLFKIFHLHTYSEAQQWLRRGARRPGNQTRLPITALTGQPATWRQKSSMPSPVSFATDLGDWP